MGSQQTHRTEWFLLIALGAQLYGSAIGWSAEGPPSRNAPVQPQFWAVVIGINKYADGTIPPLQYCDSDAHLIARYLKERCGYTTDRIVLITDKQTDIRLQPLRRSIQNQLGSTLKSVGEDDTILVYFSGHGFIVDGKAYLAPQDCERNRLAETGLPIKELADLLEHCPTRQKVLVLDCCHAGSTRSVEDLSASSQELSEAFSRAQGMATLASCQKDERSHEWHTKQQGLFTYFFAEGLAGAADYNHDRIVTADEIFLYVSQKVPTTAQKELNGKQTPWRNVFGGGVIPIAKNQEGPPTPPPPPPQDGFTNSIGMSFARLDAGQFSMGSPETEEGRDEDEGPQHPVRIVRPFFMGLHEVTQNQYQSLIGSNPSHFSSEGSRSDSVPGKDTGQLPVEGVTWEQARRFCSELSRLAEERRARRVYRLPTEAEWEYACRAGTDTPFSSGTTLQSTQANFNGTLPYGDADAGPWDQRPTAVGTYPPNRWGLFDMHGNVWEWCEDWYATDYYGRCPQDDPRGPDAGAMSVVRGGAWSEAGSFCRAAERFGFPPTANGPNVGFRVVCEIAR